MTRRRFTYREVVEIVMGQLGLAGHGKPYALPHVECPLCGKPIDFNDVRTIELDHRDAIGFGDERDHIRNVQFVHRTCHRKKTADDKRRMAKADRAAGRTGQKARRKRRGGSQIKSGPMPGTKTSGWRKPMNRPAERREP